MKKKNLHNFKVSKGHTYEEYLSKYGKGYLNNKLRVVDNKNDLNDKLSYWEIDGKYYQVDHSRGFKLFGCLIGAVGIITSIVMPICIFTHIEKEHYQEYKFQYWNNCNSLDTLQSYVQEVVNPDNSVYIPKEDRIAVFDMDGTLYGERSQIYIEWLMYKDFLLNHRGEGWFAKGFPIEETIYGTEKKETHFVTLKDVEDNIQRFINTRVVPTTDREVDPKYTISLEKRESIGGAMLFSNLTIKEYLSYVDGFLEKETFSFANLKFKDMFYKPMIEVVEFLQLNNFDVYVVSGTDRYMVRDIVKKHLNIEYNKVIGMDVELYESEPGIIYRGSKLLRKNVKVEKVQNIVQEIGKVPVLSFGNSSGDCDMHNFTLSKANKYKSQAYMVLADDNDREYGYSDSTIAKRTAEWHNNGYQIFSMKNDFKTIYGDNVLKKE